MMHAMSQKATRPISGAQAQDQSCADVIAGFTGARCGRVLAAQG